MFPPCGVMHGRGLRYVVTFTISRYRKILEGRWKFFRIIITLSLFTRKNWRKRAAEDTNNAWKPYLMRTAYLHIRPFLPRAVAVICWRHDQIENSFISTYFTAAWYPSLAALYLSIIWTRVSSWYDCQLWIPCSYNSSTAGIMSAVAARLPKPNFANVQKRDMYKHIYLSIAIAVGLSVGSYNFWYIPKWRAIDEYER